MTIETPDWVRDAVFYQVFPDRFAASERVPKPGPLESWDAPPTTHGFKGGDLRGVAEKLDHLQDLGATALYLTPVFASAANHRYHTYDYLAVDPLLGGDDALRELLDRAHARGMRVVLDGVFNHTGRGFWAFHHVLENGAASPYRHWFHFDAEALDAGRPVLAYPGAHLRDGSGEDSPWMGEGHPTHDGALSRRRLGYAAWWDLPALPKLNTDEHAVREYLFTVAEHWLRFGIDGWRLDVPTEIRHETFWQEFRSRCRAIRPDAYLVGEIWDVAPEWLAGDRFDALMNYPLGEAILSFAGGSSLDAAVIASHHEYAHRVGAVDGATFARRLEELMTVYDPAVTAVQLNLIGSHDTPRARTVMGGDPAAMELAVLLQATLPGTPCIYYGDEIGLEGGLDPDCRGAFPWDESRWDVRHRDRTRAVLRLRAAEPALRRGRFRVLGHAGGAVAYERALHEDRLIVVVNAGDHPATVHVALDGAATLTPVEIDRGVPPRIVGDGPVAVTVAPRTGHVLRPR
jgi:cyclomaltodextrinase